jgi:hypothetical protein
MIGTYRKYTKKDQPEYLGIYVEIEPFECTEDRNHNPLEGICNEQLVCPSHWPKYNNYEITEDYEVEILTEEEVHNLKVQLL